MIKQVQIPRNEFIAATRHRDEKESLRRLTNLLNQYGIDTTKPFDKSTCTKTGDFIIRQEQEEFINTAPVLEDMQVPKHFYDKVNYQFELTNLEQEKKGLQKYNQHLDPMDKKHNWVDMIDEEMVDGYKYLQALRHELHETIHQCLVLLENTQPATIEDSANLQEIEQLLKSIQPKQMGE